MLLGHKSKMHSLCMSKIKINMKSPSKMSSCVRQLQHNRKIWLNQGFLLNLVPLKAQRSISASQKHCTTSSLTKAINASSNTFRVQDPLKTSVIGSKYQTMVTLLIIFLRNSARIHLLYQNNLLIGIAFIKVIPNENPTRRKLFVRRAKQSKSLIDHRPLPSRNR